MDDRQFQVDLQLTQFLVRRNESPAYIVASDKTHIEWYAALLRVADRCGCSRVRHRYDDISLDRMLDCKSPAEPFSELVNVLAENDAVLLGKVDMFE